MPLTLEHRGQLRLLFKNPVLAEAVQMVFAEEAEHQLAIQDEEATGQTPNTNRLLYQTAFRKAYMGAAQLLFDKAHQVPEER